MAVRTEPTGPCKPVVVTGWALFIIFVLGPREPLIPLLIVPASSLGMHASTWRSDHILHQAKDVPLGVLGTAVGLEPATFGI